MEEARLALGFAFIWACGCGGVFSIRSRTSSRFWFGVLGMTGRTMFENANLKVGRAEHHITDLHDRVAAFFAGGPVKFLFVKDPKAGKNFFQIKQEKPLPPEFALIIGDAVHNLRAALDQMIWEILAPFNPDPEKVQFPFCKKADRLESVIRNREIHLAGEKIENAVRNAKPYEGGNETLYGLHRLDIADKHKLLLNVEPLVAPDRFKLPGIDPNSELGLAMGAVAFIPGDKGIIGETPYKPTLTRRERRKVPGLHAALRARQEKDLGGEFSISFDRGQPFGGRAVIPVMVEMREEVVRVINTFGDVLRASR